MDAADRETVAETGIEGFEAAMRRCLICSSCPTRSAKSLRNIWACFTAVSNLSRGQIQESAGRYTLYVEDGVSDCLR